MDREKGTFQRLCYDSTHPEKLSGPPRKKNLKNQDLDLFFVQEDGAGAIWIGSSVGWITRYDPRTKKTTHYQEFNNDGRAMQEVAGGFTSREGVLWLTTWSGHIYRFDPFRGSISHFSAHSIVKSIYEEVSGELWLGTMGDGLYKTDKYKKSLRRFTADSPTAYKLHDGAIGALCEGENNTIWIGFNKDLYKYNKKTQSLVSFLHNPQDKSGFLHGLIDDILQDQPGSLWITRFGVGLDHLDTKSGLFTHYRNDPKDNKSLSHNNVTCLLKDHIGNIWIGTLSGTLNLLNPKTQEFKHFPCSGRIGSIVEDFENCIWVGTTTGLYRSNPSRTAFSLFTNTRIPPVPAFMVTGILEDDQHNLWLSSPKGIFRISHTRSEVSLYSGNQGVIAINFAHDLLRGRKGRQGELYFADRTGYYTVLPDQFKTNTVPPQIVISAFSVLDQPVSPGKGSPLRHPLSKTKEIKLSHDQNIFSFDVVGIHYSSPEENQLLFMLENWDNTWRKAESERKAYYYNVPPGSYVFRVKAANCDGVWAEKSIKIIISPPWWETWWFRMAAAVCIIVVLYSAIRWRVHRKFRMQLERSEKEKQLADLKHKTAELEMYALRSQMNPHFIFNSLNSINQFILQNDKAQASEYLTKFSRLVRLILQNSQAALIPLDSELEALHLYLELEALRFNDHFDFTISIEEDLDTAGLKVPPLIIQPYAENAIWHGLMHKKENGHLKIELSQANDMLYCKIADDGIGRKRAVEIKSKTKSPHQSMGMRITADRIALLQQQKLIHGTVQIRDLVLPDGSAGGTEVILKLPVRYD
jgi:ligand-binding sensor domain-containing protein